MSKGIGGYMPRKDRVQGSIGHLQENCEWCGLNYRDIRKGTVKHNMDIHHEDWPTAMPVMNFVPFETAT